MGKKYPCAQCRMRRKYDENPQSIIARFWRWHTIFCPGWKEYLRSLGEEERNRMYENYNHIKK